MTKITLRSYNREIEAITDQGKIDIAIAHCVHILKFFPKHVDTYRLLGKAYLENQRLGDAADVLQRVLSAIPDDFVSHIGMSIIREDEGNLDAAIWHMQRAYDVQSSNITIQDELRRLFERRDGIEPPKIRLTRAALARMYARGDLVSEAIAELRAALQDEPDRTDLLVLLARMYSVNQQRVKCIQTCSQVLNKLPYCLEANLVISQALKDTNRAEEAEPYLARAQELDPYTAYISEAAPRVEQVPDQAVTLLKLDETEIRTQAAFASQPDWVTSLGERITTGETSEPAIDWLLEESASEDVHPEVDDFSDEPGLAAGLAASAAFGAALGASGIDAGQEAPAESPPQATDEIDLSDLAAETEMDIPDWMADAGWAAAEPDHTTEETAPAEETAWAAPAAIEDSVFDEDDGPGTPAYVPEDSGVDDSGLFRADIPEWLQALAPSELSEDTAPNQALIETHPPVPPRDMPEPTDSALPDWLQDLDLEAGNQPAAAPGSEEIPDWLREFGADEPSLSSAQATSAGDNIPDWLRDSEPAGRELDLPDVPSTSDKIPDWLSEMAGDNGDTGAEAVEDMPDWLGISDEAADQAGDYFPADEPAPDSLFSMDDAPEEETTPQAAEDAASDEIPDWLKEMTETSTSAEDPSERTGVTLWLERNAQEPAGEEAPPPVEGRDEEAEVTAQFEPPAWLHDLSAVSGEEEGFEGGETSMEAAMEEPHEEPAEEGMAEEPYFSSEMGDDDALRWLESLAARQGAREEELLTAPEDRTETPPDWVQSMAEEYAQSAGDQTMMAGPETADLEAASGESVPEAAAEADALDWDEFEQEAEALPEIAPETAAAAAMAWLPHLEPEEEPEGEEMFLAQPEEPVEDVPAWPLGPQDDEDVPEWLQEVREAAVQSELPAWLQEIEAGEEGESVAEVPDWLQEIAAGEAEEPPAEEATTDMPAWLQETILTRSPLKDFQPPVEEQEEEPAIDAGPAVSAEEAEEAYAWQAEPALEQEPEHAAVPEWSNDATGSFDRPELPGEQAAVETAVEMPAPAARRVVQTLSAPQLDAALNEARGALGSGEIGNAIGRYRRLIKKKHNLGQVIEDLKEALQYHHPVNVDIWSTLGDAYARNDNLQDALDAYTKAEELVR